MSQQQPQFQTGTQFGQQQFSNQQGATQGMGQQMGGRLPAQQRDAISDVSQAIAVCGWCADQCIQEANPHMIECIRLCEDVVELGEALLALAPPQLPIQPVGRPDVPAGGPGLRTGVRSPPA